MLMSFGATPCISIKEKKITIWNEKCESFLIAGLKNDVIRLM